jgi:hypothetical protein
MKFRFWSYGGEAMNDYLAFNCGANSHCVTGAHNNKAAKQGKKTLCGRPTKNLFNMDDGELFSTLVEIDTDITVLDGGQVLDGLSGKELVKETASVIKSLCPVCVRKARKLA